MSVLLVHLGDPDHGHLVMTNPGPWREVKEIAPGLLVLEPEESLSRVFHEIKWLLPGGSTLLVAPLAHRPKVRGLAPGTVSWLRARLPLP